MAPVKSVVLVALCGCSSLQGFSGDVPPFATFTFEVTGDLAAVRPPTDTEPPSLHVALIWGQQWLTEALCLEGPGSPVPIDPRGLPITVLSIAPLLGEAILRINTNESVTSLFKIKGF